MTMRRWKGTAAPVRQVTRLTPANVEVGDVFVVTCNGKSVSFTATAATVANVTAGLADALATRSEPEFKEFSAQDAVTSITLTANVAGKPFTVTASTVDGGGANTQTLTVATPTPATGPNHFDNSNNWSGGAVPTTGDDVSLDSGSVDLLYALDQGGVALASLSIDMAYTGRIGLPLFNAGGYYEYRSTELAVSATTINIGYGLGAGTGRIKLNTGAAQTAVNVNNSGQPAETGLPAVLWRGTHADNVVNVTKGTVGIAFFPGDAATVATLRLGFQNNRDGDAVVRAGAGAAITTIEKNGGTLEIANGCTTFNQNGGDGTIWGGSVTTLNVDRGELLWNSTGTLVTANVTGDGHLDFSKDQRAKTVTNPINRYGNSSKISDPFKVVGALVIDLEQSDDLGGLEIGTNLRLTRGATS